ncbi:isoleucine--tRNA ligase [Candidatus Parcubacteria bacterium]|nr:MAG: isoleucine--tRNA ligase [Candidatus Parcubacteria bacterium]
MKSGFRNFFGESFNLPALEEKVLKFWNENRIFEKSVALRKQPASALASPRLRRASKATAGERKTFVFFEGPPTANGKPGIHHVLARAFKDLIPRYKTMQGFQVPRKGGWDTHGLPVELEVEKQLGLKSKKDIEKFGIAAFNKKCRESVWKYKDEWERLTERMGFWIDLKHPYITYENNYIETLWWIIKEIWKKGLLHRGHKVVPWCPRCGTALSSHELAQGYDTVTDQSVYVKFKVKPGQSVGNWKAGSKTYILSWTTTPWTLPGNVALAVGKSIEYVWTEKDGEEFIASREFMDMSKLGSIGRASKGSELVGLEYEPLFPIKTLASSKSHKIYEGDFVTTEEGTGVVHTAVMYGEDDYQLGTKVGLPQHHTVDETGKFTKDVPGLAGLGVKDEKTEKKIFEYLKKRGLLFSVQPYSHEYPFCWRCGTALIYYARESWFVLMSKFRAELIKNNKTINWTPEHLKEGRFGEWLREAKDWNFSRERYWGTPLPVWRCTKCGHDEVVGSREELREKAVKRNTFLFMRHGEARSVVEGICGPPRDFPKPYRLTERGQEQVRRTGQLLAKKEIDLIVSSPLVRTRETAAIVAKATKAKVKYAKELIDIHPGIFEGKKVEAWDAYFQDELQTFDTPPPKGESRNQAKTRMLKFFRKLDKAFRGKMILIVGHGDPLWLLSGALNGLSDEAILKQPYPKVGELYEIDTRPLPLDEEAREDFHRPYVDEIRLRCSKCKGEAVRAREVADVWFDSGAMPFAQWHYPFENRETVDKKRAFPADYISEAVDQTRGWFYTLLSVSTLLGKGAPYKNVICLGHINDKFGQKMSKSKGNIVDPWLTIQKYGVDAVRWNFYSAAPPGEPKNFDEAEILKTSRKLHLILYNSLVFYRTYALGGKPKAIENLKPKHVLDRWVVARLGDTIRVATRHLDAYEVREAALAIEAFVDDLSRWYIRRSRRRFQPARRSLNAGGKPESKKDFEAASEILGGVLLETAKLLAPFTPFFADALYGALSKSEAESVHLADWPEAPKKMTDLKLVSGMSEVRRLASLALAKREEAKIKVRQPLPVLKIKSATLKGQRELLEILRDEVNVKQVSVDPKLKEELWLDTTITPELREEGIVRELIRAVQDLRQKAELRPKDRIILMLSLPENIAAMALRNEAFLKKEVGAKAVQYKKSEKFGAETETKIENWGVWLGIRKA